MNCKTWLRNATEEDISKGVCLPVCAVQPIDYSSAGSTFQEAKLYYEAP